MIGQQEAPSIEMKIFDGSTLEYHQCLYFFRDGFNSRRGKTYSVNIIQGSDAKSFRLLYNFLVKCDVAVREHGWNLNLVCWFKSYPMLSLTNGTD